MKFPKFIKDRHNSVTNIKWNDQTTQNDKWKLKEEIEMQIVAATEYEKWIIRCSLRIYYFKRACEMFTFLNNDDDFWPKESSSFI